jgi:hypothetical protein
VGATDSIVVAGPSAIAALTAAFAEGRDLDWSSQVTVVATPPSHRQLAAVAAALVNAGNLTRLVSAGGEPPGLVGARLLVSDDAAAEDRAAAARLAQAS